MKCIVLAAVSVFVVFFASIPGAEPTTLVVFGPENFVRATSGPAVITRNFNVVNPAGNYTLIIYNGGLADGQFGPCKQLFGNYPSKSFIFRISKKGA